MSRNELLQSGTTHSEDHGNSGTTSHSGDKNLTSGDHLVSIVTVSNTSTTSLVQTFQKALGIPSASSDPASGIYASTRKFESNALLAYRFYRIVISASLILQILLGAILTALGAAGASHIVITVVSAVATIVAGILALLKGQGLPNRCRSDWAGWKSLHDYIDERHGEIAAGMWTGEIQHASDSTESFGGGSIAVWNEIRVCEKMYKAIVETVDNNLPDNYVTAPGATTPQTTTPANNAAGGTTSTNNIGRGNSVASR